MSLLPFFSVTLDHRLDDAAAEKVLADIRKAKGVISANFNRAAKHVRDVRVTATDLDAAKKEVLKVPGVLYLTPKNNRPDDFNCWDPRRRGGPNK